MSDIPQVLRPHQRRSLQARLETSEEEPFGHVIPPSLSVMEALEKAFPVKLPDVSTYSAETDFAQATFGMVQRQLGQQEVLQFLRNLINQSTQGA
jgi:hypothetical protein